MGRGYAVRLGDVRKPGVIRKTRLGSASGGDVIAGVACRQHAGIRGALISEFKETPAMDFRS